MKKKTFFRKPTALAVGAAVVGVVLHLSVFFLFRIDFERPVAIDPEEPRFAYAGDITAENSAFVDPLILLLSDERAALPAGVSDFRDISISREISPHPPSLLLRRQTDWGDWVPRTNDDINPGTWILGRTVNPLRDYARDGSAGPPLDSGHFTVRIEDLSDGSVRSAKVPLPREIRSALDKASPPNPPVFLFDRSESFSRPPPLSISSSGDVSFDRLVGRSLADGLIASEVGPGYYRLTLFFPPPKDET